MGNLISNVGSTAEAVLRPLTRTRPSTEPRSETPPKTTQATADEVRAAIQENGDRVSLNNRTVKFSYDEDLNRVIVQVFSSETDPPTVVRQIPPEEYLTFAARFRELQGILFDQQA